jgi:hypothetical protein
MGWAWAKRWAGAWTKSPPPASRRSLVLQAYRAATPVTVHVAIGTDTPHMHPAADAAAIGSATHRDFRCCAPGRRLARWRRLSERGIGRGAAGSFSEGRFGGAQPGPSAGGFTTANFDFLQHYRPRVNVVERPHAAGSGGAGYAITGHHELMIPLLAAALIEKDMTPEEQPVPFEPSAGAPEAPAAPEQPAAPEFLSAPPRPPERDPFWGYSDLFWFFGLAIPSMLAGEAVEWLTLTLLKLNVTSLAVRHVRRDVRRLWPFVRRLRLMFLVRYDRPFWRSLGWKPTRLPVMWVMLSAWSPRSWWRWPAL